jgi:hypothetical protein
MMKKRKKKKNNSRRLWYALMLVCAGSWGWFFYLLFFVRPYELVAYWYAPFFGSLGLATGTSLYLLFRQWSVAIFVPLGISLVLVLRLLDFDQWYYPALTLGLVATLCYFFTLGDEDDNLSSNSSN